MVVCAGQPLKPQRSSSASGFAGCRGKRHAGDLGVLTPGVAARVHQSHFVWCGNESTPSHALDFPGSKGLLQENLVAPWAARFPGPCLPHGNPSWSPLRIYSVSHPTWRDATMPKASAQAACCRSFAARTSAGGYSSAGALLYATVRAAHEQAHWNHPYWNDHRALPLPVAGECPRTRVFL